MWSIEPYNVKGGRVGLSLWRARVRRPSATEPSVLGEAQRRPSRGQLVDRTH